MSLFKKKKKVVVEPPKVSTKVQFKHFINEKLTLAFCAPTVKGLPTTAVEFKFGHSKVHPKDQYSKKIGRAVSESHLTSKFATLCDFHQYNGYAYYEFSFDDHCRFTILLTYGKEIPFLIDVSF